MRSDLVAVKERADALVKLALQRAAGPVTGSAESVAVGAGGGGSPFTRPTVENAAEQLRHYNGRVYAAIRPVAHRIASMEWMVGRVASAPKTGAKLLRKAILPGRFKSMPEHVEALPQHPILDVLHDPNRLMVAWTLKVVSVVQLLLTGKCFWWLVPPKGGKAAPRRAGREIDYDQQWQIWPLPASWVRPVHEEGQPYASWKIVPYGSMGKEWSVPLEEIAYFYLPDPQDPTSAHSPLQANARAVVSHEAINEAQRRSFHRPFPGLVFTIGRHPDAKDLAGKGANGERPMLSGRQREEIIAWVQAMYEGMDQYNKPLIQDALIEKVEQLAKSPREMDFMKSNDAAMGQIDEGIGTNPVIMGRVEQLSRASSAVADDHFCFPAETEILTAAGVKRIAEIVAGDFVFTHRGRWREVTGTMRRNFTGELVTIAAGGNVPLRLTGNHPIWLRPARAQPAGQRRCEPAAPRWAVAADVKVGDFVFVPGSSEPVEPVINAAEWLTVQATQNGRVKLRGNKTKKDIPASIVVTPALAFALGLYLAEGHCSTGGVCWTVNARTERSLKDDLDVALADALGEKLSESHPGSGSVQLYQYNATFKALLVAMFGKGAARKRIPARVFGWPEAQRRAFATGYLRGDGNVAQRSIHFKTVSSSVAWGMRYLLATLEVACAVSRYAVKSLGVVQGRLVRRQPNEFVGIIAGSPARAVASWLSREMAQPAQRTLQAQSFAANGGVWFRVRSVDRESFAGDVFNFSVADDESYCTTAGAVHNCRNTVNPIQTMMSETLTSWLPPLMAPHEDICIFQEPAASVDVDHELAKGSAMVAAGCFLMNEVRRQFGEEPHPAGDRLLVTPMGLVPWDGDPDELAPADPAAVDANGDPVDPAANDSGAGGSSGDPAPDDGEPDATDPEEKPTGKSLRPAAARRPRKDAAALAGVTVNLIVPEKAIQIAVPAQQPPQVTVQPAAVTVNLPELSPQVNVSLPEMQPAITLPDMKPELTVKLAEQPAPVVNVAAPAVTVNLPQQAAPQVTVPVTVEVPPPVPTTRVVQRDASGNIQTIRDVPQG